MNLTQIVPPDYWFRVIADLERSGFSLRYIASKTGASKSSLCRYKEGVAEPRYSEGMRLIALRKLICPQYGTQPQKESVL